MIGVNEVGITSEVAPFGGIKHSGIGREHSKYGMDEFLYIKWAAYLHLPSMRCEHRNAPMSLCRELVPFACTSCLWVLLWCEMQFVHRPFC